MLPVSAPFHCALMKPAAKVMAEALNSINIQMPKVPLISNVTAAEVTDPSLISTNLVDQVTALVRWRESILYMKERNVDTFVEVGSGKVLSGLTRRISRDLQGKSLQNPDDFDIFLKEL